MPTHLHFIDVGQGNMTLCQLSDGTILLYDCNITDANASRVLTYLSNAIGKGRQIDIFVNSHRDADHMRGVKRVHAAHPIRKVWDSGVTGTTPSSTEYREYMELRRAVPAVEVERLKLYTFGQSVVRVFNAQNAALASNPNAQSIVLKLEHRSPSGAVLGSALLTGDTDAATWRNAILPAYKPVDLSADILLASHHGAISFFDDPADRYYYKQHLDLISPADLTPDLGHHAVGGFW